ncbi:hypothetical protein [Streptomyces viridochromogenes]|uniref:hypothetical protein n=1 Tax=Streptomyces viridochromogenes TaxID=1938 RepID=UPI00069E1CA2|nr:hypothetical protein [Streptomyces viridochromogenes]
MARDVDPSLFSPPDDQSRARRFRRRLRVLAARLRAMAWKAVGLFGEEFIKGFANKAGGIAAIALCAVGIAYLLGMSPADAVRAVLKV